MMNSINIFKFVFRKKYYIIHPWKFFQELYNNIKDIIARAIKGHAWRDSAEMDDYLLHIIPSMLRDIANGISYPEITPFETHEKWQDWCNSLADVFESVQQENWSQGRNEWENAWRNANKFLSYDPNYTCTSPITKEEHDEINKLYLDREKELQTERQKIIQDAYSQLAKYHDMLWI